MKVVAIKQVLADHKKWLANNKKGKRADLRDADLHDADLRDADLRESYNALITEALDVIGDLTSSATCMHCDLHDACAEGEDGMPTACNQFLKARQFCEKYKREKDTNGECPF